MNYLGLLSLIGELQQAGPGLFLAPAGGGGGIFVWEWEGIAFAK